MFVTVGGKGVMLYAILGLVDPGDEVLVPDPGYPIYESLTRFVGATPVPIPIRMANDFRLDVDELASLVTPRTRVLIINSPANPTGGVLTRADLERIAELAIRARPVGPRRRDLRADPVRRRGARVDRLAAGDGRAHDRPRRLLQDVRDDRLAAGLRDRAAGAGQDLRPADHQHDQRRRRRSPRSARSRRSTGPQDDVDAMVVEFKARRDLIVDGLNAIPGIECRRPVGAFYVFPSIAGTGLSGAELAERLLLEAGVCVLAGSAFGEHRRRPHPDQLRQLAGQPDRGARRGSGRFVEPLVAARV